MLNVSTVKTNDQRQSFRPVVSNTVELDQYLAVADHVPATVQDLFRMVNALICPRSLARTST